MYAHSSYDSTANQETPQTTASSIADSTPLADPTSLTEINATQVLTIQDVNAPDVIDIPAFTSLSSQVTNVAVENRDHSIKDFLSRNRVVASGTWSAGGTAGVKLLQLSFPNDLLTLPSIRNKAKGFLFLRSDVEITIIFTAAPTTSGGIRVITIPDLDPQDISDLTATPLQQSQFPNQVFSLASLPQMITTLPWISPLTHRNLALNYPNPQNLLMSLVAPLSGVVSYIVYARFVDNENFSLTQATPMNPHFNTFSLTHEEEALIQKVRQTKLSAQTKTEAAATKTSLSNVSATVGSVASMLSGVPLIGSVASVISPIANLASGIFSAFGWSRPNNETPTITVKQNPISSNVNCDNTHTNHTFGMQMLNKVSVDPGTFGSSTDDMHLEKFLRHPNLVGRFSLSTADKRGKIIYFTQIGPFMGCDLPPPSQPIQTGSEMTWRLSHQGFVAALFDQWHADIILNFHIFTTQYHSVKIRFASIPGHYKDDVIDLQLDDSNSTVVNFGQNTTHQVRFPNVTNRQFYDSALKYLRDPSLPNIDKFNYRSPLTSPGSLYMIIEVPLQATSTVVAPTIDGIVEMYMVNPRFAVSADLPLEPKRNITSRKTIEPIAQMGPDTNAYGDNALPSSSTIVDSGVVYAQNADASHSALKAYSTTVGEAIVSLKQMITQFTQPFVPLVPELHGNDKDKVFVQEYDPFSFMTQDTSAAALGAVNSGKDKIDYISSAFAFRKGSMNVRIYTVGERPKYTVHSYVPRKSTQVRLAHRVTDLSKKSYQNQPQRNINIFESEGISDIHCPYYQPTHMVNNVPSWSNWHNKPDTRVILTTLDDPDKTAYAYSRACGDDFAYGYQIALPEFTYSDRERAYYPHNLKTPPIESNL